MTPLCVSFVPYVNDYTQGIADCIAMHYSALQADCGVRNVLRCIVVIIVNNLNKTSRQALTGLTRYCIIYTIQNDTTTRSKIYA